MSTDADPDTAADAATWPATPLATETATPAATRSARPRWTLNEAAGHTGVSRTTLRRRLTAGAFPSATRDASGTWHIGVEDLLAAGFTLARPIVDDRGQVAWPPEATETATPGHLNGQGAHEPGRAEAGQVATLQAELAAEQQRRRDAERTAEVERQLRQAAEAHRDTAVLALKMIGAGPAAVEKTPEVPTAVAQEPETIDQPQDDAPATSTASAAPVPSPPAGLLARARWLFSGR